MSKQKQIGTLGETAVVSFLKKTGWPLVERRTLHGVNDEGDVTGTPGICWEVKSGKAAESASDGQVKAWLKETERERVNANAELGILVTKRKGIGITRAGEWWAHVDGGVFADLVYEPVDATPYTTLLGVPVRTRLADLVRLLREAGYGDPL